MTPNRKATRPAAITPVEYDGLQQAFEFFNAALFDNGLADLLITYQRRARSYGYFSPDRFFDRGGAGGKHELALNPDGFIGRSDEQIASTLVHEMVHEWQQIYGDPPSRGYHDQEWSAKMKAIGLQPSSSGLVGGKETGQRMSHYIVPDGPFATAFARLAASGWRLNLQSAPTPGPNKGPSSKTKFTCPSCGVNAWGKPDLEVDCRPCRIAMVSEAQSAALHRTLPPADEMVQP